MSQKKSETQKTQVMTPTQIELPEIAMSKGELVTVDADPKDQEAIAEAMSQINLADTQSIINFGIGAQRQLTAVSEQMLDGVKNKETGEAGNILNKMVTRLRGFDVKDIAGHTKPGFFARLFGMLSPIAQAIQKFETVKNQIDDMESELESHVTRLMKDVGSLDRLYESSLQYFHDLAIYIAAGEAKLQELDDVILPELKAAAETSDDVMASQKLNDMNNARNALERKIHDLKLTRQVTLQSLPSIRIIQDNDNNLITKIQSSIVNTVPLWKTQMAQALTIYNAAKAGKAVKAAADLTNDLLVSNAENLRESNAQIRTEVERAVVDIASIEKANEDLIATINESIVIYEEGKKKRADAEKRLVDVEDQLRERLKSLKEGK